MKKLLRKKYVLGFIAYYILYILMLMLVNWFNVKKQGYNWTAIFTNLNSLDGTLAPLLFAVKFLYLSVFIFGVFLLFNKYKLLTLGKLLTPAKAGSCLRRNDGNI